MESKDGLGYAFAFWQGSSAILFAVTVVITHHWSADFLPREVQVSSAELQLLLPFPVVGAQAVLHECG